MRQGALRKSCRASQSRSPISDRRLASRETRHEVVPPCDPSVASRWYSSCQQLDLSGIVFQNGLRIWTLSAWQTVERVTALQAVPGHLSPHRVHCLGTSPYSSYPHFEHRWASP